MRYQPKRRYIKQFAFALEKVYVPGAEIDMSSTKPGDCGTPGCFGWLTLRALEFISGNPRKPWHYDHGAEAVALSHFLETGDVLTQAEAASAWTALPPLAHFATRHPRWWGGDDGEDMFICEYAFSPTGEYRKLKESDIVVWWIAVSRRPVPKTGGSS